MKPEIRTCIRVGLTAFAVYLAVQWWPHIAAAAGAVFSAALPLFIGGVIAYVLGIPMLWYEKLLFPGCGKKWAKKLRRVLSIALAFITVLAIMVLVVVLIVPQLVDCVQLLLGELPDVIDEGIDLAMQLQVLPEDIYAWLNTIDWSERITQIGKTLINGVGGVVGTVVQAVSSVFSGIVTGCLSLIFSIYLLMSKDDLARQGKKLIERFVKQKPRRQLMHVLAVLDESFHKYIVGQCTEAIILGVMCMVGMWILRLPYAAMISALIAFTALIPVAGAYIGGGIGAFMIFTVSPVQALVFLIYLVVLQQLEGNLVYPRVVGTSIGLPPLWVLAAVTIGGGVLGIAGMLLGVPLAAALYRLVREQVSSVPESANE